MQNKIYIIAEAGVNHNGSFKQAVKLIDAAVEAKADAIKFQTFIAEECISKNAELADYQKTNIKNQYNNQLDMVKRLELSFDHFRDLYNLCLRAEIDFLSTPFDFKSIDFLSSLDMTFWKIPSGEINNLPYLKKIGSFNKKLILSTGMASLGEIESALAILENAGTHRDKIIILHCNTEYPTPMYDVNLKAMQTIKYAFPGVKIGYSDHTLGIEIPIAAAAMGARVIEKHFTMDKTLPGPDHKASLDPKELTAMVLAVRNIEKALGNGIKKPSPSESKNIYAARKSIVAACDIKIGEKFTDTNLRVKRPGIGINPMKWNEIIGKTAKKNYSRDDIIHP